MNQGIEHEENSYFITTFWLLAQTAIASVCDYRPSQLIGGVSTGAVAGGTGAAAVTGIGLKAAVIYTLTHATTGVAMLGSTATGITGIIAGSAGFLDTASAVLMSPFVIVPAVVTAVGIGAYEGSCYLSSK